MSILKVLNRMRFNNFIDIGGGEGYISNLVRKVFGVEVLSSDLSYEANLRARELYDIGSICIDAACLPFPDDCFELVLCSEVLEHLSQPFECILELLRITSKYLVITTQEFCQSEPVRKLRMKVVDRRIPHVERNWWVKADFELLLDQGLTFYNQMYLPEIFLEKDIFSEEPLKHVIQKVTEVSWLVSGSRGCIVVKRIDKAVFHHQRLSVEDILDILVGEKSLARPRLCLGSNATPSRSEKISPEVQAVIRCPDCKSRLAQVGGELVCSCCNTAYEVRNGIPVLYPHSSTRLPKQAVLEQFRETFEYEQEKIDKIERLYDVFYKTRPIITSRTFYILSSFIMNFMEYLKLPMSPVRKIRFLLDRYLNKAARKTSIPKVIIS